MKNSVNTKNQMLAVANSIKNNICIVNEGIADVAIWERNVFGKKVKWFPILVADKNSKQASILKGMNLPQFNKKFGCKFRVIINK